MVKTMINTSSVDIRAESPLDSFSFFLRNLFNGFVNMAIIIPCTKGSV
jgi:hypothetical protein